MYFAVYLKTYKLQGSLVIKLGDAVIPYHEDFKFYITSKLPNPHYTPETSTKVTLVNFTLSPRYIQPSLNVKLFSASNLNLAYLLGLKFLILNKCHFTTETTRVDILHSARSIQHILQSF